MTELWARAGAVTHVERAGPPAPSGADLLEIIQRLPDVIFRCERRADGRIYFTFNEGRLAEEFNVTTNQIIDVPLDELFPGGASEVVLEHFHRAFDGDETEFVNEMDGRWFKHHPSPLYDESGSVVAVVGFITEVTEIKRAQRQVEQMTERLAARLIESADANRELAAFSYTLSHDLRGPMSVIEAQCHTMEQLLRTNDLDRIETGIQRGRRAVRRMRDLVDDILVLLSNSDAPLKRVEVDVSSIAHELLADLAAETPGRDVHVDVEPGLVARADVNLLRQLLQNLIGNAWKYTSKTPSPQIRVTTEPAGVNGPTFVVSDNGPGFSMADAETIFQPFRRLDNKGAFSGSGVGLATAARIVQRHGGRIWADSRPGSGATFRFTLAPGEAPRGA